MISTLINMFGNKCPNCNKGKIFEKGLLHFSFVSQKCMKIVPIVEPNLKKNPVFLWCHVCELCTRCGRSLNYLFYLHAIFEETFDLRIIPIIGTVILSLTLVNIKLSRIIWIYIFKEYSV